MEAENTQKEQMGIARMRFGIIAPLVQGTYPDESIAAYCRRVARTPLQLPDGRVFRYKPKTVGKRQPDDRCAYDWCPAESAQYHFGDRSGCSE